MLKQAQKVQERYIKDRFNKSPKAWAYYHDNETSLTYLIENGYSAHAIPKDKIFIDLNKISEITTGSTLFFTLDELAEKGYEPAYFIGTIPSKTDKRYKEVMKFKKRNSELHVYADPALFKKFPGWERYMILVNKSTSMIYLFDSSVLIGIVAPLRYNESKEF